MPLVLDPIQSGYNLSKINDNFQRIEDTWDEKLDRVNSGSFYNQMDQALDMNSNEIINAIVTDDPTSLVTKEYVDALFNAIDGAEGIVPKVENRQQGDGVTTLFNSPATGIAPAASFFIQIDGITQRPITDYSATGAGNIQFTSAPPLFSDVDITFFEPAVVGEGDVSDKVVIATNSTTSRTLADRFADVTNIKDFGAVGNGIADDSVAIQAAINVGGIVMFPEGTYNVKNLELTDDTKLVGSGAATVLHLHNPTQEDDSIFKDVLKTSLKNVTITSMQLTGDAVFGQPLAYNAIYISNATAGLTVDNIDIRDVLFSGFSRGIRTSKTKNLLVENCVFENCFQTSSNTRGYGILYTNCNGVIISNNNFKNTVMRHCTYAGDGTENVIVTNNNFNVNDNNSFRPTGFEHPVKFLDTNNATFSDNTVTNGYQTVVLEGVGDSIVITGNQFNNTEGVCMFSSSTSYDDIVISNNIGDFVESTGPSAYPIRLGGTNKITATVVSNNFKSEQALLFCRGNDSTITLLSNYVEKKPQTGPEDSYCILANSSSITTIAQGNTFIDWDIPVRLGKITATGNVATGCSSLVESVEAFSTVANNTVEGLTPDKVIRSNTAILAGWTGTLFTNRGATIARDHTLPNAVQGLSYTFTRPASVNMELIPAGGETFREATPGQKLQLVDVGSTATIMCSEAGIWDVIASRGTISYFNT